MTRRFRESVAPKKVKKELLPGQSPQLLQALHLLDREGRLHADARRKLKQINHLIRLLEPAMEDALSRYQEPVVVDAGAGNAYLGFILHELFVTEERKASILAVESRPELAKRVKERADMLSFTGLKVLQSELSAAPIPDRVHILLALHACDTATDDALIIGITHKADHIAVVPCCQAEVARGLSGQQAKESAIGELWRHKWHRREFGAHITNVIRALVLEAYGYQVTVTELAGWEHSVKNELILGRKVHADNRKARQSLENLLDCFPLVRPKIIRELEIAR